MSGTGYIVVLLLISCCYLSHISLVIFRTHQRCLAVIFCPYIDQMHKSWLCFWSALFSGSSSMSPIFLFIGLLLLILLNGNFPTTVAQTPNTCHWDYWISAKVLQLSSLFLTIHICLCSKRDISKIES